ncbi:hypothetical protein EMCRGX_G016730 [Ephydatia muelleri]
MVMCSKIINCSVDLTLANLRQSLLERGSYIKARDKYGQTALHISSKNGHTDTMVALLERGADINARDKYGQTALHISTNKGHTDTMVALLERGADINARDKLV